MPRLTAHVYADTKKKKSHKQKEQEKKKTQQVLQTTRKANDINKNLCKKCENKAKRLDKPIESAC